ncbi:MAG TPA: hypothetical protein VMV03_03115 [Spirochaetia bacterium]|nr:hypothetical protein [Spirochaetia bacterium]
MSDIVPRSQVTRQGVIGVGALAGGAALLILAGGGLFGIIAGGVLIVAGLALSSSKSDRTAGVVTVVVGAAALVTGILGHGLPIITWLMRAAGFVLLGTGIYSLVRFFSNLRKRS